jgi:hypothetical protein
MVYGIIIAAGLLILSYYIGREIGRTEAIRDELRRARDNKNQRTGLAEHEVIIVSNR